MYKRQESHSAGVVGPTGHGVSEQYGTYGRVDIYTGTLGKAFGGALGGFTTGRKEIIDLLRQRSRPYPVSYTHLSTAAHSQVRAMAPKLRTSVMPSSITNRGFLPCSKRKGYQGEEGIVLAAEHVEQCDPLEDEMVYFN